MRHFPDIAAEEWLRRISNGLVVDEHGAAVTADRVFEPHLRIYYYRSLEAETRIPFEEEILFQDDQLVAVDKPHFLPVIPSGRYLQETLLVRLKRRLGLDTLVPIHRIDRGTAGVVVFSVRPESRGKYQRLFATREVRKNYEAVGSINPELRLPLTHRSCLVKDDCFMRMKEVEGAANSETRVEWVANCGKAARDASTPDGASRERLACYRLSPVTGRKHQLRVHCAAMGIPIANDAIYPEFLPELAEGAEEDFSRPLQLLARSVEFRDPVTGETRSFTSRRRLALWTH